MISIKENEFDDSLSSFVKVFDNALTQDQCDFAVNYFDDNEEEGAKLSGVWSENGTVVNESVRNVMEVSVEFQSPLDDILSESCGKMLSRYVEEVGIYPPDSVIDRGYSVNKYTIGEHYYNWHVDSLPDEPRTASMIWYLNDVDEGGETEFSFGMKVKPKKGNILIFPSNFCFSHRGCVPLSGSKYIALAFIGNTRG